ncbi:MAG TPA: NAD-dependent epimerase/dehydratase family protein [Actinomycetota bacterium]
MSRVLVTGGVGFIGSHVVDELVSVGIEVVALDRRADRGAIREGVELVRGDVRDSDTVEHVLRGADAVCHQGSMVGLGVDLGDLPAYVSHNDVGTAAVLTALHRTTFRGRLVLASSMVVYGEGRYRCGLHGVVRPGPRSRERLVAGSFEPPCPRCGGDLVADAVDEDAPVDPRNVYAATKVHQEHLAFAFARETGTPVTALRYHNVYGPRMPRDTPYAGVASLFRSALEAGRSPRVFEDGRQLRDFVHVTDVARANVLALTADPPVIGVFNVASGTPRSVGEMASALAGAFGPDAPRPVVTGEFRLGDVRHVFASPGRAERALGFRARIGFEEGMRAFARSPLRERAPVQ